MKKLGEQLGSRTDTQDLRDRIQEGRRVTNAVCKDTTNMLRTPADRDMRAKQDKLKRTLQAVCAVVEAFFEFLCFCVCE